MEITCSIRAYSLNFASNYKFPHFDAGSSLNWPLFANATVLADILLSHCGAKID